MKIALLVPGFATAPDDWTLPYLRDHASALSAAHDVHVYALRWPEKQADYAVAGAQVHALGGHKRMGARAFALWARAIAALRAEHRRRPFDVLQAVWGDEPSWLATWIGNRLRLPVVISLAGGELLNRPDLDYGLQRWLGRDWLLRWAIRRAARVTSGSAYFLRQMRAHFSARDHAKLACAPLGVDIQRFQPAPAAAPGMTIINVGSLTAIKGQERLLRALARVSGFQARLIGDGPLRAALQTLATTLGIADRIIWTPQVEHLALPAHYQAAGWFCQTSWHEAQGMAALEAAACGLPVIGTPVGVLPEFGLVANDDETLLRHWAALAINPLHRRACGEAARAYVREHFALEVTTAQWGQIFVNAAQWRSPR
jgi:glycosyltransferase involved in cell wall biosynthesis